VSISAVYTALIDTRNAPRVYASSCNPFFGMKVPEAAKAYLAIAKKPKSTGEIADALVRGGLVHGSSNFFNTVYTALDRDDKRGGERRWQERSSAPQTNPEAFAANFRSLSPSLYDFLNPLTGRDETAAALMRQVAAQAAMTAARAGWVSFTGEYGSGLARGNPLAIGSLADVVKTRARFVNRQKDAGTRMLLDVILERERIAPESIAGYDRIEFTHTAVAALVAEGSADCGLGLLAAARTSVTGNGCRARRAAAGPSVICMTRRWGCSQSRLHWSRRSRGRRWWRISLNP